jgi:CheY-like chemotaxis protein
MPPKATILLVDDQQDDARLVQRCFERARILNPLMVLNSGQDCVKYLSGAGEFSDREEFPLPALLLLDLRMPGMDGYEVISWIRSRPEFQKLRIVVLTGFGDMASVSKAYQQGANSFITKPMDFEKFIEISQTFGGLWLWLDTPENPGSLARTKAELPTERRKLA